MNSRRRLGLSPNIILIGLISFLTDVSSELIFTRMPLFLANVVGAATVVIGLIEGVAESTASLLKLLSGWLSDKLGNRKHLAFAGYALSTLSKPGMLFAGAWGPIMAIRFAERVGKGIRAAPRDALVGDSADDDNRGKAYGFHKAMDTAGAALGLMLAAVNCVLIAVAATRVNPRVGRNGNLLFALFTFIVYYNMVNLGSSRVASGASGFWSFNLALHGGVFAVTSLLLLKKHWNLQLLPSFRRRIPTDSASVAPR